MTDERRDQNPAARGVAERALGADGIASAVIFAVTPDGLWVAGAAGIDGVPLERLVAAVRNPAHPIARTVGDAAASFDVEPTAPGGPALRSHLPVVEFGPGSSVIGVLAVAHEDPLDQDARARLTDLAREAGQVLVRRS